MTDSARLLERYKQANAAMSEELNRRTQERDELLAIRDDLLIHLDAVIQGIDEWLENDNPWNGSDYIELFTRPTNEAEKLMRRVRDRIDECVDGWVPPER